MFDVECCCVMHVLAYVARPRATLAILFSKIDFFLFKRLYFYSSQFNILLGFKLALLPLDLEFKHHWGTGARVIRSTKCGVYTITLFLQIYNLFIYLYLFLLILLLLFEMVHILLTIVIMHYIFLISIQLKFLRFKVWG